MVRRSATGNEHLALTRPCRPCRVEICATEQRIGASMVCGQLKCFHNLIKAVAGCVSLVWNVPSGQGEARTRHIQLVHGKHGGWLFTDLTCCLDPIFAFTPVKNEVWVWLPRNSLA